MKNHLVIRESDVLKALEQSDRGRLRMTDPEPRKPVVKSQNWKPGTEVQTEDFALCAARSSSDEQIHKHNGITEIYTVVRGTMLMLMADDPEAGWTIETLEKGDTIVVPPQKWHMMAQTNNGACTVVQVPPAKDDKVVLEEEVPRAEEARSLLMYCMIRFSADD